MQKGCLKGAEVESSSRTETNETSDATVSKQMVSPGRDLPSNIDHEVSQDYVLPSNIDPPNLEYEFTMQPFAIELFCGSAGLTASMRTLMPSSFGIDHSIIRPKSRVIQLSLLDESSQKLVEEWARHPNCLWLHFGVPCGTASRAREIRLNRFAHGPPPLWDQHFPDGLPPHLLSAKNLLQVRSANRLYSFMMRLILKLDPNKIWTIGLLKILYAVGYGLPHMSRLLRAGLRPSLDALIYACLETNVSRRPGFFQIQKM